MDKVAVLSGNFVKVFHQGEQCGLVPDEELWADGAPAARLFGYVFHSQCWIPFKGGNDSGGTIKVMLRACLGTRRIKPRLSSVSTIEWTLGGVILKNRCMSASAGAQPFRRRY
jgi:hypothetical protein